MHVDLLDLLRCPYCGTRLSIVENAALVRTASDIRSGVLGCECCAFPIVDGIPVLIANDEARLAMHQLEAGRGEDALFTLLTLEGDRADAFRAFLTRGERTYREGLRLLSLDAEGEYFIYRFSDPTFLVAQALLRVLAGHRRLRRRTIDLCGGSGHLTRVLAAFSETPPLLADVYFWKLWLAKHFTAPGCEPVCCDGNTPLPFARQTFSMVVCSDAFPYIWQKRLLADEMMRLTGEDGVIVMPHLHSALGENFTAGMTLTPEAYRDLFEPCHPRLFRDSALLNQVLDGTVVDLAHGEETSALAGEPALALIASRHADVFRAYELATAPEGPRGEVVVNPLYHVERRGDESILTLSFPTPEYEQEFAAAKRYLPPTVIVNGDLTRPIAPAALGDHDELRRRLVLIDAPKLYY